MAEKFIINASDAALAVGGETTASWAATNSTGAPTDAEVGTILTTAGNDAVAVMDASPTAAQKAAVAFCLLDSLTSEVDLSSRAKRKAFKLKRGLAELLALQSLLNIEDQ